MANDARALPAGEGAVKLPHLGAQVLAALGPSPTRLTERAVKRIKRGLPIPQEQDVVWADVTFGTRTHGVAVTGQGLFLKDGPSGEEDDDVDWSQEQGAGYHYLRWRNFDPSVLSVRARRAYIAGVACEDTEKFYKLAQQCVRMAHADDGALEQAKEALAEGAAGLRLARGTVSAYGKTAAATWEACKRAFEQAGEKEPGALCVCEVPLTQYDAVLKRAKGAIAAGKLPGAGDARLAGMLVRKGAFTYRQAMNVAKTRRVQGLSCDEAAGQVRYAGADGVSAAILAWLSGRSAVRGLNQDEQVGLDGVALTATQAAGGIAAATPKTAQDNMLDMAADTVISSAGRSVGFAGARALTSALGVAAGPVGAIAGLALGNICGEAVPQAVSMAKGLFVEPAEQVYGRMFDAVLRNVVFEHALTQAEQAVLGVFMRKVDPRAYQALLASLRESATQEQDIRDFIEPAVAAVRSR